MTRRGAWTTTKVRERIRVGVLISRLRDHVLGKLEMTPTQVQAAQILLRKSLPDLAAVEHSGALTTDFREMSREDLASRLADTEAELAASVDDGAAGKGELSDLH